ncbi:transcription initiation factor TFIID subunit 4b isoform X2 [Nymphaea colorata]|uniref:transcription initiation factor TFIID subunit 4b isoform X2 n=1 Tax=Nymphaea colorata TaxID=210225 RepID=UPI00129D8FDC|nr:transcription initiation factor TFIID subunit 4b isoform X2 [Nymphaea colorata]
MDPSIMKLLEEDEDEHMHSGADVEALTAALNRDIGGTLLPQTTTCTVESDPGALSHGDASSPSLSFGQWQQSALEEENVKQEHMQEVHQLQQIQGKHPCVMDQLKHGEDARPLEQKSGIISSGGDQPLCDQKQVQAQDQTLQPAQGQQMSVENNQLSGKSSGQGIEKETFQKGGQYLKSLPSNAQDAALGNQHLHPVSTQQSSAVAQSSNPKQPSKPGTIPFALLLPVLTPHLDKDRTMQLQTLFVRLRKNEVSKEDFLRVAKDIVGDQMLRKAVELMQEKHMQLRNSQKTPRGQSRYQFQSSSPLQDSGLSGYNHPQVAETQSSSQIHALPNTSHKRLHDQQSKIPNVQMQANLSLPASETTAQKARQGTDHHPDRQGVSSNQAVPVNVGQVIQETESSKVLVPSVDQQHQQQQQQQQHMPFPQSSFSMYGGTVANYYSYGFSMPSVTAQGGPAKMQGQDPQVRQMANSQGMAPPQLPSSQPLNLKTVPKHDLQSPRNETKRPQSVSHPQITGVSAFQPNPSMWQTSLDKELKIGGLPSSSHMKQETSDHVMDHQHKPFMSGQGTPFSPMNIDSGNSSHGPIKEEALEKQSGRVNFTAAGNVLPANPFSSSLPTHLEHSTQNAPSSAATTSSTPAPPAGNTNARATSKKTSAGQKKPLDASASPTQLPTKKQKTSGEYQDQSIEQLNDVTAVSGVNLKEEEEQLLSAPKEESRASEAMRRLVQEEEERLILQRDLLQRKVAQIMAKSGIKNASSDVDQCLSMCVEECLRGLLCKLIRMSKQRADLERGRHKVVVTSDVRRQILLMNRKAKEELEKKHAEEAEKLQKQNEAEGNTATDTEKDDGRMKSVKVNKEEDDKMRTTAANVAARAAVGGDDMLSKWQLMAEQARQKREGGVDGASGKDVNRKALAISAKAMSSSDNHTEGRATSGTAYGVRSYGRSPIGMGQAKIARTISIKDVISVLQREPHLAQSTLLYRLYEWMPNDSTEKAGETT